MLTAPRLVPRTRPLTPPSLMAGQPVVRWHDERVQGHGLVVRQYATSAVDELAQQVVEAALPAVLAKMPLVAQSFVDQATPLVQKKLIQLQPEIEQLARAALYAAAQDDQVRASIEEATDKAASQVRTGLFVATLVTLAGTALIVTTLGRR